GRTSVTISTKGGTPDYTGTGKITVVGVGSHTETVDDGSGYVSDTTVELSAPPALVASNTHGTISCFGGTTSVTISATGGTPGYTGTGTITGVGAGSHTYTVTDANGCTSEERKKIRPNSTLRTSYKHGTIS